MSEKNTFDRYEPDYGTPCIVCGQTPTVTLASGGEIVEVIEMCGPCTFGTAKALDPDWWNRDD